MSTVIARLDDAFLNKVLSKLSIKGEKSFSGTIPIPLLPDPSWSVTIKFSATNLRAKIGNGSISLAAKINVDSALGSYTSDVSTTLNARLSGTTVLLKVNSLVVSLYVAPMGNRIELGNFDILSVVSVPVEIPIPLPIKPQDVSIPAGLGGGKVTVSIKNPSLKLTSGVLEVSTELVAA